MARNKILLLFVSLWITSSYAQKRSPASELLMQAEQTQKTQGDAQAIEFLWSHSEKLERPELMFMAKTLVKLKNFKDILKVSELALSKNPKDAEFLTFQGKAYLETQKDRKNLEKAQESLRSAIEVNPKFEPAYLILDDYYERQDKIHQDQKKPQRFLQTRRLLYEDLIQNRGETHLYSSKLCQINTMDGVNALALKHCKKAIEFKNDDILSQLNLAQVYKQSGEKDQARSLLKSAAASQPPSDAAFEAYGLFLEEEKNFSESYIQYKNCNRLFPEADKCLRGLGTTAVSLKKWTESFEAFQKICKKNRKWSSDVRKASITAKELGSPQWEQKLLELSLNCNI